MTSHCDQMRAPPLSGVDMALRGAVLLGSLGAFSLIGEGAFSFVA